MMNLSKPFKLILFLLGGLCVLSVLAFVTSSLIFPRVGGYLYTNNVGQDVVESSDGVAVPEFRDNGNISKDLMYPPTPGYGSGGDGSKLIKNAQISMTVVDFDKTVDGIKSKVEQVKGFVQYLSDSGTLNNRVVTISIRVPEDKFTDVLNSVKGYASEVKSVNEGADDISEVYQDTQARLKTQKAYETQLLKLLERATKVTDIITIQQQLSSVREQIEMYELQLKNFDSQVSMSTLSITLSKASEAIDVAGEDWKLVGVLKEASSAFVGFGKGLLTLLVWALVFSPVVLIPYVIYKVAVKGKK